MIKVLVSAALCMTLAGCGGSQFVRMSQGHVSCSNPEVENLRRGMGTNTWTASCPNGREYSCSQVYNGRSAPVNCTEIED